MMKLDRVEHRRPGTVSLSLSENDDEASLKLRPGYRNVEFLITTGEYGSSAVGLLRCCPVSSATYIPLNDVVKAWPRKTCGPATYDPLWLAHHDMRLRMYLLRTKPKCPSGYITIHALTSIACRRAGPGPVPSLDGENIVFGRVLEGFGTIAAISNVPIFKPNERIRGINQIASLIGDERAAKVGDRF